jgi:hypothetical protein
LINLVHTSCAHGEGSVWDRGCGTGQVRPHLAGPTAPARPAAPAGPAVPGGVVVLGSCGTLVPFPPKMCTCP